MNDPLDSSTLCILLGAPNDRRSLAGPDVLRGGGGSTAAARVSSGLFGQAVVALVGVDNKSVRCDRNSICVGISQNLWMPAKILQIWS